ncbi:hypothetical protein A3Q56_01568 [Intoshia linei]|uniref:acid phosphatase n=1 Tax=Intoshia linei TaxID=1819745 RepID=A0A177B932_9BILA|nr:hypothetical protein A3Q56_01568 [Intoshia linei]
MKKKLSIFITIIVLNLTCATNYTILKALVFAKHGEQSPVIFLKNDEKIWPFGPNKITINGKKSAHTFGEFLKIRYIEQYNLIEKYRTSETLFQSTQSESSIMSSIIALAKLFEPKSVEQHHWDKDIDYVPVPIHMILKSRDFILFPESCKYIIDANKKIMEQVKFKEILEENKEFIDKINDLKLLKGKMNFTDLHNLAQNLIVKKSNDIPLPEWANNKMGDETYEIKLFNINQKLKKVFYNNKNYYTTAASFPISTVLDDFQGVLDGTDVTKFELYVAVKLELASTTISSKKS